MSYSSSYTYSSYQSVEYEVNYEEMRRKRIHEKNKRNIKNLETIELLQENKIPYIIDYIDFTYPSERLFTLFLENKFVFTKDDVNKLLILDNKNKKKNKTIFKIENIVIKIISFGYELSRSNLDLVIDNRFYKILQYIIDNNYDLKEEDFKKTLYEYRYPRDSRDKYIKYPDELLNKYTFNMELYLLCFKNNNTTFLNKFNYAELSKYLDINILKTLFGTEKFTLNELKKFTINFKLTPDLFNSINIERYRNKKPCLDLIHYLSKHGMQPDIDFYKKLVETHLLAFNRVLNYSNIDLSTFTEYKVSNTLKINKIEFPTVNNKLNEIINTLYEDSTNMDKYHPKKSKYIIYFDLTDRLCDYLYNKSLYLNNIYYFNKEVSELLGISELENKYISAKNIDNLVIYIINKYLGERSFDNYKPYKIIKKDSLTKPDPCNRYSYITNKMFEPYKIKIYSILNIFRYKTLIIEYGIDNKIVTTENIYFDTYLSKLFNIPENSYIPVSQLEKFLFNRVEFLSGDEIDEKVEEIKKNI